MIKRFQSWLAYRSSTRCPLLGTTFIQTFDIISCLMERPDELNHLLEFLTVVEVLHLRQISRNFRRFIDQKWVCRYMLLSEKLIKEMRLGSGMSEDEEIFSHDVIGSCISEVPEDATAPCRLNRKKEARGEEPRKLHFLLKIYCRGIPYLRHLIWIPGPANVQWCPISRCTPKFKVNAPNLDVVLEMCSEYIELIDLRCCYMNPGDGASNLRTPLDLPCLHTLIHTTRSESRTAIFQSPPPSISCPALKHIELSAVLPASYIRGMCYHLYESLCLSTEPLIFEQGRYGATDYGFTTCQTLPALLISPKVAEITLHHLWGASALVMLTCVLSVWGDATHTGWGKKNIVIDTPFRDGPPKVNVLEVHVSELPHELVHSARLLDALVPFLPKRLVSGCDLHFHAVPAFQTPLALGRNMANKSMGGDVEASLTDLIQILLSCDDDTAQNYVNMWRRKVKVDLFAGSLSQPRVRKPPATSSFKYLRQFRSITLNVSCLCVDENGVCNDSHDTDSFLQLFPSFNTANARVIQHEPCKLNV
eukprot:Blabericola_migrator_1__5005@NODE_259_length_10733_cov_186_924620_g217_i0_p4_GENE_NODE_259_length_10733_cov_186_924620_g217_i0NODE_259_length_10733_cov_186_924620_g217_i0_p4_ORF_typecomplete_len534_score46_55Fbox/PF00646_33/0_14Fbox/PF00646_33/2_6e03_NODE_259_length_10733_cov_186_924620_g217_i0561657